MHQTQQAHQSMSMMSATHDPSAGSSYGLMRHAYDPFQPYRYAAGIQASLPLEHQQQHAEQESSGHAPMTTHTLTASAATGWSIVLSHFRPICSIEDTLQNIPPVAFPKTLKV
jgi:hypothetical protein